LLSALQRQDVKASLASIGRFSFCRTLPPSAALRGGKHTGEMTIRPARLAADSRGADGFGYAAKFLGWSIASLYRAESCG